MTDCLCGGGRGKAVAPGALGDTAQPSFSMSSGCANRTQPARATGYTQPRAKPMCATQLGARCQEEEKEEEEGARLTSEAWE